MSSSEAKRTFLVVSPSGEQIKRLEELIKRHVSHNVIYNAPDGSTALMKAQNDPPHVIFMEQQLAKLNSNELIQALFQEKRFDATAIVILGSPPEKEIYLDEIVTGRIQFLEDVTSEKEGTGDLFRALNYSSHKDPAEYYIRYLAKGDLLLREGDKADFVYILKSGRMRAFHKANAEETALGTVEVGEFVGEMAYINGEPRSAHVDALEDCELIEIPIGTFDKILYRRPAWSKALMMTLSKRLNRANSAVRTAGTVQNVNKATGSGS